MGGGWGVGTEVCSSQGSSCRSYCGARKVDLDSILNIDATFPESFSMGLGTRHLESLALALVRSLKKLPQSFDV